MIRYPSFIIFFLIVFVAISLYQVKYLIVPGFSQTGRPGPADGGARDGSRSRQLPGDLQGDYEEILCIRGAAAGGRPPGRCAQLSERLADTTHDGEEGLPGAVGQGRRYALPQGVEDETGAHSHRPLFRSTIGQPVPLRRHDSACKRLVQRLGQVHREGLVRGPGRRGRNARGRAGDDRGRPRARL